MNDTSTLSSIATDTAARMDGLAERAGAKADDALASTRRMANSTLDRLQDSVDQLRDGTPGALSRVAAQVDELTRKGLERARQASIDARQTVERTGDRTVGYIQAQPVKSVLIAAATGAALAALIGVLARSRSDGH